MQPAKVSYCNIVLVYGIGGEFWFPACLNATRLSVGLDASLVMTVGLDASSVMTVCLDASSVMTVCLETTSVMAV